MGFERIRVTNFRSFDDLEIKLSDFNVLIGANASGKSNFIQIFEFFRALLEYGFDSAVSSQGDADCMRNAILGNRRNFRLEVEMSGEAYWPVFKARESWISKFSKISYEVESDFSHDERGRLNFNDRLTILADIYEIQQGRGYLSWEKMPELREDKKIGSGRIVLSTNNFMFDSSVDFTPTLLEGDILIPQIKNEYVKQIAKGEPTMECYISLLPAIGHFMPEVSIYDFDPKLAKEGVRFSGITELEEDGSNLSLAVRQVMKDPEKEKAFHNIMADLLPFVDRFSTDRFADRTILFGLKEKYCKEGLFWAPFVSDGTISVMALIIALFFEKSDLCIFEEPERNIHPYVISRMCKLMREASRKKQILLTTHNPEIIKHTRPEDLLLISRDKSGYSRIYRPLEKKEIKSFLEEEIGIDELYAKNLLEIQ